MYKPLVTVIIPTYNSATIIHETLNSVITQSYINWECILVDDGSTDQTVDVVKHYNENDNRFKIYSRPKDKIKGPASSRNHGVKIAKGEFIIFLDSDDLLAPFCIEERIKFMKNNPLYDFWVFKMAVFEKNTDKIKDIFNILPNQLDEDVFYLKLFSSGKIPFAISCPFWKRESFLDLNGFNEQFLLLEDPELHLRVLKHGVKVKTHSLGKPDCFYRIKPEVKKNELKDIKKVKIILKYHFQFMNLHCLIATNESKLYLKRIFLTLLFPLANFKESLKFISFGKSNKMLTNKQIITAFVILLYNFFGLEKTKMIGYYKLQHYFYKTN